MQQRNEKNNNNNLLLSLSKNDLWWPLARDLWFDPGPFMTEAGRHARYFFVNQCEKCFSNLLGPLTLFVRFFFIHLVWFGLVWFGLMLCPTDWTDWLKNRSVASSIEADLDWIDVKDLLYSWWQSPASIRLDWLKIELIGSNFIAKSRFLVICSNWQLWFWLNSVEIGWI